MATTYGTIPTLSSDFPAGQAKRIWSSLPTMRPWREMVSSLSLPDSFNQALSRIHANAAYFRTNYIIIIIFMFLLSLLWHPFLLIIFVMMTFAWLFLYVLHDDPTFLILGYEVDESVVVTVLTILTVVLLVTQANMDLVMGVLVGIAVALLHGACRSGDLIMGEDHGAGGGDMMEAASSSFSSHA